MRVHTLLLAALLAASAPSRAQQAQADAAASDVRADEIVVTGQRVGRLNLDRLLRAETIFRDGRPQFAPAATLLFQLRPHAGQDLSGLMLTLRKGDRAIPVPIDAAGRFTLPDLQGDGWELTHNRASDRIAIRAIVLSPGATESDRPLGDLRLQCRVGWELLKPHFSLFARAAFDTFGGCDAKAFHFNFYAPRAVAAASVTDGGRATPLPLTPDHRRFRAPLADHRLPNAARVRLTYS